MHWNLHKKNQSNRFFKSIALILYFKMALPLSLRYGQQIREHS